MSINENNCGCRCAHVLKSCCPGEQLKYKQIRFLLFTYPVFGRLVMPVRTQNLLIFAKYRMEDADSVSLP